MRELPISCVTAKQAKKLNAADAARRKQIEKAKTVQDLKAIANKLRAQLHVAEGTKDQMASRIVVLLKEMRTLLKSRENRRRAVVVLAAEVARGSLESHADDIAAAYDPNRIPF